MMTTSVVRKKSSFIYTWTVENIPLTNHIKLQSPLFVVHSISWKEWFIYVHLAPSCLWCTLVSEDYRQFRTSMVDVEFSLLAADGSKIIAKRNKKNNFLIPMVSRETFLERKSEFLPNNTLTIQCRMWRKRFFLRKNCSDFCHVRTRFQTHAKSFIWPVEKFSELKSSTVRNFTKLALDERKVYPLKPFSPEGPFMALVLYLKRNSEFEEVCVDFLISNDKNYSFCWEISVIDSNGEVIASKMVETRSYFVKEITNFISLISKNKLIADKNLFLPNDTLLLRCSFKIFTGVLSNEIEYCTQNVSSIIKDKEEVSEKEMKADDSFPLKEFFIKETYETDSGDSSVEEKNDPNYYSNSCSLKPVWSYLYSEATLSDVSQRIATKLIPVPQPQEYPMFNKSCT